ncbi:MAG: cation:proton antiporter [Proteobacteria bacterium]|nr:cation:proton antiporter [Pseudomonadota bacterium]
MDAVDVAFTEAAVGAGISTVLMLITLWLTSDKESNVAKDNVFPLVISLLLGGALFYATADMPHFGSPSANIHQSPTAQYYVQESYSDGHIPNIVTTVLASYRGYDTLGETTVVFTAAIAVMMLLGRKEERTKVAALLKRDDINYVGAKMLIPYILLFALYVQFHGDFGPGGGFQAGVMFAAAFVLHSLVRSLAETQEAISLRVLEFLIPGGVLLYAGTGILCMIKGGNFLEYNVLDSHNPVHGQHMGILLVEAGVGITVFSAILALFFTFALRGRAK